MHGILHQLKEHMSDLKTDLTPSSYAVKDDAFKPQLGLIPKAALDEEAAVFAFGSTKYDVHNWRKGMPWSKMINAALRHLTSFNDGDDFDNESALHHLAHVRACCAFLIEWTTTHPELDDRYKRSTVEDPLQFAQMLASLSISNLSKYPPIHVADPLNTVGTSLEPPWLRP